MSGHRLLIDFSNPIFRKLASSQGLAAFSAWRTAGRPAGLEVFLSRLRPEGLVLTQPVHFKLQDFARYESLVFDLENRGPETITVGLGLQEDRGEGKLDRKAEFAVEVPAGRRAMWRIPLQQLRYSRGWWSPWGWPRQSGLGDFRFMGLMNSRRVKQVRVFLGGEAKLAAVALYSLRLESPIRPEGWVDRLGQRSTANWPTKARNEKDIARWEKREAKDLPRFNPPRDRDEFSAWTGKPVRRATGFFRVEKVDGRWWFVAPNGRLYYATGMDVMICGVGARLDPTVRAAYSWMPPKSGPFAETWFQGRGDRQGFSLYRANLIRKWGPERYYDRWLTRAIARQVAWGFTSVGNWSDSRLFSLRRLPYFSVGPVTHDMKVPYAARKIHDAFHPKFESETRRVSAGLAGYASDPWLVGHFVDNEIDWAGFPQAVVGLPAGQPSKRRLIERLRRRYRRVKKLNQAWGIKASSFKQIRWPRSAERRHREAAARDLSAFRGEFADRFYRIWNAAVREADPDHLVLGSRLHQGNRPPEVIRACARHMDVISFNHYDIEATAEEFGEYHRMVKKPFLIGEYGHNSLDSGLLTAAVPVKDQRARATGYRYYTERLAVQPYFVGGHFFQYLDEPITGRFDRETAFNGFVSITDVPYPLMVRAARASHARIYRLHAGKLKPFSRSPDL